MAKHVILESYTFTPSTKTIVVNGKGIRREQLLLITNTTAGTVIYNFSDPALGGTITNTTNTSTGLETTTIVTAYNTAAMASTDKLSILTEETYQEIIPSEVMRDPVEKLRVSTPQSLIDTDFEYGLQPTKWEQISLLNNRPSSFYDSTAPLPITGISASGKVVTVLTTTPPSVNTPVFIQGTLDMVNADGWWLVETVSAGVNFTYTTTSTPNSTLYDSSKTYVFSANTFTGAAIPLANTSSIVTNGTRAFVYTSNNHGLRVGSGIYVMNTNTGNNSSYIVETTPSNNTFTYLTSTSAATLTTPINTTLYPRPLGYVEHRAMTGAVQFTNLLPYHGYQTIRQTRRQFRYQSGKGIQFSTGSLLKPLIYADTLTASGTTITVTSKFPHGMVSGANVIVSGAAETAYNGTFTVTGSSGNTFTYTALTTPTQAIANGTSIVVSPSTWYGGSNRVGMFDQQNGAFFEYDGQTLYVVKRSSVKLISGVISVNSNSVSVTGSNTKFSTQLATGDWIVIRGMSYLVQSILSDTSMSIYPEYRGSTNIVNSIVTKTVDTRYPQSTWNIDPCNGTGASLYNVDLTKMQMFYIDYTWYGAGAIRFGFKNNRGEVIYAHRVPNNNLNTEAYLRSGNLPARYETNTIPSYTYLTATLSSAVTTGGTITVADTTNWPSTGTVVLSQPAVNGAIEYISYTAKTATSLTVGTRATTGGASAAQTFTVVGATAQNLSGTAPIKAELYAPQFASTISHWGSSVIMDGRYDDDRGFVFSAGMPNILSNQNSGTRYALMSLRLAPSVDQGQAGLLGVREILNRMQLTLRQLDAYTTGAVFRIDLVLNGRVGSGTFSSVGGSSLAQIAYHAANTTITGGETVYSFFSNVGNSTSQDLNLIRDIGNSIYGGGINSTVPTTATGLYPDGPDVIAVCATAFGATNSITARVSWTEAQA
jgi:hypothetical protein